MRRNVLAAYLLENGCAHANLTRSLSNRQMKVLGERLEAQVDSSASRAVRPGARGRIGGRHTRSVSRGELGTGRVDWSARDGCVGGGR